MMPLALDPSETRTRPERDTRSWATLSIQAVLGLGMFAGCAYGVYALASGGAERVSDVRFTKVDEWPEIKDGVPAAIPRKVGPTATASASSPSAPVAAPAPAAMPFTLSSPMSASSAPGEALAATRPLSPAPVERAAAPPSPAAASLPLPTPRPAIDPAAEADRRATTTASTAPAAPLPPRKPELTGEQARAKPPEEARPKRVAAVPPAGRPLPINRAAEAPAAVPAPAQKAAESEPAADADHVNVLGMKVPTLSSTGRKLMQTVDDIGDAVRSLPGKL